MKTPWITMTIASSLLWSHPTFASVLFDTGNPDGLIATASRPGTASQIEIQTADDFVLKQQSSITGATFTGLVPLGTDLQTAVSLVDVQMYHVFPFDSVTPPDGKVPSRVNSPSDNQFAIKSSPTDLSYTATVLNKDFTAKNSVVNGINPSPNNVTGGEGPVTGEEVRFNLSFKTPFDLPADHYFFNPEVGLDNGNFLWLSAPHPQFPGDLQTWISNANLAPDWLRIGTDVIGGSTPPNFNASFSLEGSPDAVPEPASIGLLLAGLAGLVGARRKPARIFQAGNANA